MATLAYKNTAIHYSDTGKGSAVVLLHGFLENSAMWAEIIPVLAEKYRVIAIDLLGHGQTECLGYVHTMEDNADIVHAVLAELRIRKAVFAGHSMGGYVSLAFAELYPEYLKGLALVNSTAKPDNAERRKNRDRAIKAVKHNYKTFVQMAVTNLFSEANQDKLKSEIKKVVAEALKTPLQGIVASLEGMKIRKDREFLLHEAAYPILLVLGENDSVLVYDENKSQVDQTNVELVTLPHGHMSTVESKTDLIAVLLAFLKKL